MTGKDYNSKFEEAIRKGELIDFAHGKGKYFEQDRERDEHWVLGSWLNEIVPLQEHKSFNDLLRLLFKQLVSQPTDFKAMETILYHLHVMFYLAGNNQLKVDINLDYFDDLVCSYFSENLYKLPDPQLERIKSAIKVIQSKGKLINLKMD